jgi:hypothetical protein
MLHTLRSRRPLRRAVAGLAVLALASFGGVVGSSGPATAYFDPSFHSPLAAFDDVEAVAPALDGTVYVGGGFTTGGNRLVHLNRDGTVDQTFAANIGTGFNSSVRTVAVMPDSSIVVGGAFTSFNGVATNYLVHLAANGLVMSRFGAGANATVLKVRPLSSDTFVAVGDFTQFQGGAANKVLKVKGAAADPSFTGIPFVDNLVRDVAIQPNGRLVIAGDFTHVNGAVHNRLARLTANGALDASFNPNVDQPVVAVTVLSTGRIVAGGVFLHVNGAVRNFFAFLNPNGSLVTDLAEVPSPNSAVLSLTRLPGDVVLVGGLFEWFSHSGDGSTRRVVKVLPNGYMRGPFNIGDGLGSGAVYTAAQMDDGRLVIGGAFSVFAGESANSVAVVTGVPLPPVKLKAKPGNKSATVTWESPPGDGGFPIIRQYAMWANSNFSSTGTCTVTSVIFNAVTAKCTGMKNGTKYSVYAGAENFEGGSEQAVLNNVVPRTVPTAPRALKVSFPAVGKAKVAWTASLSTGGAKIARYEVCRAKCTLSSSWKSAGAKAGVPNRSFTLSGVAKGAKLTVKVRAANIAGKSPAATLSFTQTK